MSSRTLASLLLSSAISASPKLSPFLLPLRHRRPLSLTATPYPLYYELIHHRPPPRRSPSAAAAGDDASTPGSSGEATAGDASDAEHEEEGPAMDRSKRRYYRKRRQRMYGASDSEDDRRSKDGDFVELKPEVVDFPRLHGREQELYFYDAFALPWEKDKHYRMVYQLEKKYFPEHSLDKAFVDPAAEPPKAERKKGRKKKDATGGEEGGERNLVFFEDDEGGKEKPAASTVAAGTSHRGGVTEKKVEEFFKCLKKVPNAENRRKALATGIEEDGGEPYLASRKTELPPRWDGPAGTVVLVDKPKGLVTKLHYLDT